MPTAARCQAHHLLITASPDNGPCRVERPHVLRHPVMELEQIQGLAQAGSNVHALAQAGAEPHRLGHDLRAHRDGQRPREHLDDRARESVPVPGPAAAPFLECDDRLPDADIDRAALAPDLRPPVGQVEIIHVEAGTSAERAAVS